MTMGPKRAELIAQLGSVVGDARARELVAEAARAVGATQEGEDGNAQILDRLTEVLGAAGAHMRLFRSRSRSSQTKLRAVPPPPPDPPSDSGPRRKGPHPNLTKLVELLSAGLGIEKAAELLGQRIAALKLDGARLSRADAMLILDSLVREDGVVGLAARFAKARAHLELVD